ncbi:MAG TPA: alpha/beta hydrolase [Chroococcales cyanobacterium]
MKLFVTTAGNKDAATDIVMIHGTGANANMWNPQTRLLEQSNFRCFIPDLRGHGQSEEPGEETDIEVHIQDILETLESLDVRFPVTFMGHSLGAIISMLLAERRPDLISQVLAVGMPGRVLSPMAKAFKVFLTWPYSSLKDSFIHPLLPWRERTLLSTPHHTLTQIVQNFQHLDYVSKKFEIACPVHFSVGRLDPVAPCIFVQKLHEQLPGSTLQIFEWAGHNCMDERPAAFNKWMMDKLTSKV